MLKEFQREVSERKNLQKTSIQNLNLKIPLSVAFAFIEEK
jgi:hypothetical protein